MGKKLYVGNLGYDVSSSDLETLLSAHGTVLSAEVISDRMTGRSKGFGFVEMPEKGDGESAINSLKDKELKGRKLNVNEARPRSGGGRQGGRGPGGGRRSGRGQGGGRWDGGRRSW